MDGNMINITDKCKENNVPKTDVRVLLFEHFFHAMVSL